MNPAKKMLSVTLALVMFLCVLPISHAQAATSSETMYFVEDLGNGITVETTIEVFPTTSRDSSKSAISTSNFKNNGVWIATVSLKAYFTYLLIHLIH